MKGSSLFREQTASAQAMTPPDYLSLRHFSACLVAFLGHDEDVS